jgi:uncharacterized DUF497 family protein
MDFEWDRRKAEGNRRKHGVTFAEAMTVFDDRNAQTIDDPDHSDEELRWLTLGRSRLGRILIVAHTDRGDRTRIINARKATPTERKTYEENLE